MNRPVVKFMKRHEDAVIPRYATPEAAGMDACAIEDAIVEPGDTRLVKTGLSCQLQPGWELQVRPRSGMALNTNMLIPNAPGTVDSDYRGDVSVMVFNRGADGTHADVRIKKGDRIAQFVIKRAVQAEIIEVEELGESGRGEGGFGHTGMKAFEGVAK